MHVRQGKTDDIPALTGIFHRAVREGAGPGYSAEQRAAWAPAVPDAEDWTRRLADQVVFLAEHNGDILGFMSLRPGDGYIDLAFVEPGEIGRGVAFAVYTALEAHAAEAGIPRLWSNASALARRFFERQGWTVETAQTPVIRGVKLHNYRMSKPLGV